MTDIVATLVFDSRVDSVPELRARLADVRHLIYEGEGVILDLVLKQTVRAPSVQVSGQILPGGPLVPHVGGVSVRLVQGSFFADTTTNALGEFSLHAPDGAFDLSIVLGARRFIVRDLQSNDPRVASVAMSSRKGAVQ
jgi:uncharacterized membrane protein